MSWKAYCFESEAAKAAWAAHTDDLTVDFVVNRMLDDLRSRGVLDGPRPSDDALIELIIDSYIRFPAPASA